MIKATLIKRQTNWVPKFTEELTEVEIEAENEDKLFALFFREYDNRYKYCNDLFFKFKDESLRKRFSVWISDVSNYMNNGGDMW